ncbi:MAG: VCBS repeat-containing protein [Bacteroidetes bacterium]|nr:VCBS repeat-containing protein [Bacteroidota bacterium]
MPDFVYINNGKGIFSDQTDRYIRHMTKFSMGSDAADFNNDGLIDMAVNDMLPEDNFRQKMLFGAQNYDLYEFYVKNGFRHQRMHNVLQLNNGNGNFSDIAFISGVYRTDLSWSVLFADLDYDGWKDLFMTNGYFRDVSNLDYAVYKVQEMRKNDFDVKKSMELLNNMSSTKLQKYSFRNKGNLLFEKTSNDWGFNEKRFSYGASYADLDSD